MRKNKGFTLIELLAVIVIVGILITLVSISVVKYVNTSKEKVKVQAAEEIIQVAKAYMATNDVTVVSTNTLINEGYLESNFTNPKTGEENTSGDENIYILTCDPNKECQPNTNLDLNYYSTSRYFVSFDNTFNINLNGNFQKYLEYDSETQKYTIKDSDDNEYTFNDETNKDSDDKKENTSDNEKDDSDDKSDGSDDEKKDSGSSEDEKGGSDDKEDSSDTPETSNLCDSKFTSYCNKKITSNSTGTEVSQGKIYEITESENYNFKYKVSATNDYKSSFLTPSYCKIKFDTSEFWYGSNGYASSKTKIVDNQIDKSEFKDWYLTFKVNSTNKKITLYSKNNTCTIELIEVTNQ